MGSVSEKTSPELPPCICEKCEVNILFRNPGNSNIGPPNGIAIDTNVTYEILKKCGITYHVMIEYSVFANGIIHICIYLPNRVKIDNKESYTALELNKITELSYLDYKQLLEDYFEEEMPLKYARHCYVYKFRHVSKHNIIYEYLDINLSY